MSNIYREKPKQSVSVRCPAIRKSKIIQSTVINTFLSKVLVQSSVWMMMVE